MVLAVHFKINAQSGPTHAKVGLPLHFDLPAGHRHGHVSAVFIAKGDGASLWVCGLHRHIEHASRGGRDRQERAIRGAAFFAQSWQHHAHNGVVLF